jgi:hypothetical protein
VEVEGRLSGERDLDADAGALLIIPTRIVGTHRFDDERLDALRAHLRRITVNDRQRPSRHEPSDSLGPPGTCRTTQARSRWRR